MMESKWARMDEEMTEQLEKAARLVLYNMSVSAELYIIGQYFLQRC